MTPVHVSVLRDEVVSALAPRDGETHVDCTLGLGGHSEALLESADVRVIGLDRDPEALRLASERLARFGDRLTPVRASFSDLEQVLDAQGLATVDGVLADLGVSSMQLDVAERGFSFRAAGPVDMRMDPDAELDAAYVVNEWPEAEIARILRDLGEERHARRVARAIVAGRPWRDTAALASAIASAVGGRPGRIHPATRAFQAIRMAVNDELGELDALLEAATRRLAPGGRIAIISFHSLEDRAVKRFFAKESGKDAPRDPWGNRVGHFRLATPGKSTRPADDDPNPRARSARLRTATRLS